MSNTTIPDPWRYLDPGQTIMFVTDGLWCTSNDTLEAFGLPQPVVDLGPDTSACGVVVLDAGPFDSFLWQDGSINQTYDVTIPGTYYVTATSVASCSSTDSVLVDFCVGRGLPEGDEFTLYPNPATDRVVVQIMSNREEIAAIRLTDVNGKSAIISFQRLLQKRQNTVNIFTESLASGTCILTVLTDSRDFQRQVVISRWKVRVRLIRVFPAVSLIFFRPVGSSRTQPTCTSLVQLPR